MNAFVGLVTKKNVALISAFTICTLITAVVAFIGTLIDGIAYGSIGNIKACSHDGVTFWGDPGYFDNVDLYCAPLPGDRDCYCVARIGIFCDSFIGNGAGTFSKGNCNPLIDEYPVSSILAFN